MPIFVAGRPSSFSPSQPAGPAGPKKKVPRRGHQTWMGNATKKLRFEWENHLQLWPFISYKYL